MISEVHMAIVRDPEHPGASMHPGEVLREEFLVPLGMSAEALAAALHVPAARVTEIAAERRGINVDMAYRLARYFGSSATFWMKMQMNYELALGYKYARAVIHNEVRPRVEGETTGPEAED